jgi:enamine deaminase RidA (YjgF/YER057c/UK114 family)
VQIATGNFWRGNRENNFQNREFVLDSGKRPAGHLCPATFGKVLALCSGQIVVSMRNDFWKGSAMKIERHETGPRMSKAVTHGDTVYLAGVVADSPKGKSMAEQTRSILSQIDGFLAMAGTNKTKLLSANVWITDMANFAEMNSVWDAWVSPGNTPARATVEAKLASPDYKVEIMVVAAR